LRRINKPIIKYTGGENENAGIPVLGAVLSYISEHGVTIFTVFGIFIIIAIAIKKLLYALKLCGAEAEF